MRQRLLALWCAEEGQDLVEYTLLLAFIVVITAGLVGFGHNSISSIVSTSNSQITVASQVAAAS